MMTQFSGVRDQGLNMLKWKNILLHNFHNLNDL